MAYFCCTSLINSVLVSAISFMCRNLRIRSIFWIKKNHFDAVAQHFRDIAYHAADHNAASRTNININTNRFKINNTKDHRKTKSSSSVCKNATARALSSTYFALFIIRWLHLHSEALYLLTAILSSFLSAILRG